MAVAGPPKSFAAGLVLDRPKTDVAASSCAVGFALLLFAQICLSFAVLAAKNSDTVISVPPQEGQQLPGQHPLSAWACPEGMILASNCVPTMDNICITNALCSDAQLVCAGVNPSPVPRHLASIGDSRCKDQACTQDTWEFLEDHFYVPLVLFATVFALSVLWLFLMQHFAKSVMWGTIVANLAFLVFVFIVSFIQLESVNYMCIIFAIAGVIFAAVLRKQINLASIIMKTAMDGLASNKRLFPICFLITAVWAGYFALWIASIITISLVKKPITKSLVDGLDNSDISCHFVVGWTSNLYWLWIVTYYWSTYFFQNIKLIVLTVQLSGWYFHQDGFQDFWRLGMRWSVTSLAGGNAICSAILGAVQYLMRYQNSQIRLCLGLLNPYEWIPICLSFALRQCIFTYTKFGLIGHTFTGEPFCESAQKSFLLLKDKIGEALMTDFIGSNVMGWCTWVLSLGVAFAAFAWGESLSLTDGLLAQGGFWWILLVGLVLAFCVSSPFGSIVLMLLVEESMSWWEIEGYARAVVTVFFVSIFYGAITRFLLKKVSEVVVDSMDVMFFNFAIEADHVHEKQDRFANLYDAIDKLKTAQGVPVGAVAVGNPVIVTPCSTMQVQIPPGTVPGQQMQVQAPSGVSIIFTIPGGTAAGSIIQVQIPVAAAPVIATPEAPAALSVQAIELPMMSTQPWN